jgi:Tfp pilus assembly protein PilV
MCRWRRVAAARRRLWRGADDGQSIVELGVAMAVLSVAVLGVIGTMGVGVSLTGGSRQRSSGSAVATERLERARNAPYDRLATYEQPTYSPLASSPDNKVSTDNSSY